MDNAEDVDEFPEPNPKNPPPPQDDSKNPADVDDTSVDPK